LRELDFSDGFESASIPVDSGTTTQTINNGQATTNITGMVFSSTTYRTIVIEYDVLRSTATNERVAVGILKLQYSPTGAAWEIASDVQDHEQSEDHGITFSITAAGQARYSSDTLAGASYSGSMKWKVLRRYSV